MGEDVARALGAPSPMTVEIAGRACEVRPLGIKELTIVERDCLERYRRSYIKTFVDNADLLPGDGATEWIRQKADEAARWDVGDLPSKWTYDARRAKVTDGLRTWLREAYQVGDVPLTDVRCRLLAAGALDSGMLDEATYERLAGGRPFRLKVPYANWWITGAYDGMVTMCWVCFRHAGVTREQVEDELSGKLATLVEASREIERLTVPQVGKA